LPRTNEHICPVSKAAELLGERWTLLIIRELVLGTTRFNDFQRALSQISPTLLTKRLNQLEEAGLVVRKTHCAAGASIWKWASTSDGPEPDVVTQEIIAAAWWLRRHAPDLRVRVVNVVDLMTLFPPEVHPHGMSEAQFVEVFTPNKPVIFAFHGYQRALHAIVHGRPPADRFHVRGFNEQGTTTTLFQMVVLNDVSRYHIAMNALQRANRADIPNNVLTDRCRAALDSATAYAHEHFEDPPDIRDWVWSDPKKTD
jgi:xylulose-5-phosphate/fructose-6-phosphate phosphoketolase